MNRPPVLAFIAMMLTVSSESDLAAAEEAGCIMADRWVNAWQASPSDNLPVDARLKFFIPGAAQTYRAILTPLGSGSTTRIHLSNRMGSAPVTFDAVTIATRTVGAAIDPASVQPVFFEGNAAITIPVGEDRVSDAVEFSFESFDDIAVSLSVSKSRPGLTQHWTARQQSYATLPRAGNKTAESSGESFTQTMTSRPYVVALDVLAPSAASTVVAFGDSLTDGFQGPRGGMPEDAAAVDLNLRYPDYLRRRLESAGRDLIFVSNAGISGNRVRENGWIKPFGPKALSRVDIDVLAKAGVTDVILWLGINDIAFTPGLTADQLIAGYIELIDRLHAQGLHVIQGTLTPSGGNLVPLYSWPTALALRQQVNDWIRTQSPADAVVDFDAAVRDPVDPDLIDARYDGGDQLHFNVAGNEQLAAAIDLQAIKGRDCR
jgi:lysophospholipase L1-like esterase